jgi:hypothetical protein
MPEGMPILGWSFYDQGSHRYVSDSGHFLREASRQYGLEEGEAVFGGPYEIGRAICEQYRRVGGILILDGMERLQYPPDVQNGELTDAGMVGFFRHLLELPPPAAERSEPNRLVIVTTRWMIPMLGQAPSGTGVETWHLTGLGEDDVVELLRDIRVGKGRLQITPSISFEPVCRRIARDYGGQPLALELLASYLIRYRQGDLAAYQQVRQTPEEGRQGPFRRALSVLYSTPTCYAYGAGRRISTSSLSEPDSDARDSLFIEDARLRNAEEWLLRLDYSASKSSEIQARQRRHRDLVKSILLKILPEVSDIHVTSPTRDKPDPGLEFETPYGWVPLRQLGYGYRTMIAWMVDFASRMVERYPDSPDPLAEPAVVLVDEIDLHLHPKWQRELIGFLTERFPNTQFIATAHSPLIVQAASDANIALLRREGDHVVIENNPETIRGWRVDQILTSDLFGLETARPPELEGLLLRRKELLTKPKLTRADKKELTEIESKIGTLPTGESFEQAKTIELLRESIDLLKRRKDHDS